MNLYFNIFIAAAIALPAACWSARAADELQKTNPRPNVASPEQRRARLEELRERNPEAFQKLREEIERRREEFKNLPPADREAKLKELREQFLERRKTMTVEERAAKRQEVKSRLEKQLGSLREKKTNGAINAQEARRLERMETVAKRFNEAEPPPKEGAGDGKTPK